MTATTTSSNASPPNGPGGWTHVPTNFDHYKYISEDRTSTIICKPVTTQSGDMITCRLFESENPHDYSGKPVTSAMATDLSDIPATIKQLEDEL